MIVTPIPQADGRVKNRPAIILRQMPGYGDWLVCGLSTKLHQQVKDFDEIIAPDDPDYAASGLATTSLIRLGHLIAIPHNSVGGVIGAISPERHQRLLKRLSDYPVE